MKTLTLLTLLTIAIAAPASAIPDEDSFEAQPAGGRALTPDGGSCITYSPGSSQPVWVDPEACIGQG